MDVKTDVRLASLKKWSEYMGYDFSRPESPRDEDLEKLLANQEMRNVMKHLMDRVIPADKLRRTKKQNVLFQLQSSRKSLFEMKFTKGSQIPGVMEDSVEHVREVGSLKVQLAGLKREVNENLSDISEEAKKLKLLCERLGALEKQKKKTRRQLIIIKKLHKGLEEHVKLSLELSEDLTVFTTPRYSDREIKSEVEELVMETVQEIEIQDEGGKENKKKIRNKVDSVLFASSTSIMAEHLTLCLSNLSSSFHTLLKAVNEKQDKGERLTFLIQLEKQHIILIAKAKCIAGITLKHMASWKKLYNQVVCSIKKSLKEDSQITEDDNMIEETVQTWVCNKAREVEDEGATVMYLSLMQKIEKDIKKNKFENERGTFNTLQGLKQQIESCMCKIQGKNSNGVYKAYANIRTSTAAIEVCSPTQIESEKVLEGLVQTAKLQLTESKQDEYNNELSCAPWNTSPHAIVKWLLDKLENNQNWASFVPSEILYQGHTPISIDQKREVKHRSEVESSMNELDEKLVQSVSRIKNCSDDVAFLIEQPVNKYICPGMFKHDGEDFVTMRQNAIEAVTALNSAVKINRKINQDYLNTTHLG